MKFRGGILDSPCSSVRLSVCLSVCLSVRLSVRPSVRPWVGVRMITLILFSGFKKFFLHIYHLGQDLAWDWISASYLIKYAHTGRSCDLLIFGIPEVNFVWKLCLSVCVMYVKHISPPSILHDYNQTWINMIWAGAAKTLLSQIFQKWRIIEVNCVYSSHCKQYRTSAGMPACITNRRYCAGQCAGQ